MFYPELLKINSYGYASEFINELDSWLAFLPRNQQDKISVHSVATKFNLEYQFIENVLEELCNSNILEHSFGILCPECGLLLDSVSTSEVIHIMKKEFTCYNCSKVFIPTPEYIIVLYKLIKNPNHEEMEKLFSSKAFSTQHYSSQPLANNITTLIQHIINHPKTLYDIFYNPTQEDYEKMNYLFEMLDMEHKHTSDQGSSLDTLVEFIFTRIQTFTCSTKIRNGTNQFDCTIKNKLDIKPSIFNTLGDVFLVECKNEATVPGNGYFLKLQGILHNIGINFAIICSRHAWASTCDSLARDFFLQDKLIIINLSDDDFRQIIFDKVNLLDLISFKIDKVKINARKNLEQLI